MGREMRSIARAGFIPLSLVAPLWLVACSDSLRPSSPVATLIISPHTASLRTEGTVQLEATARDANGNVLTGRPVAWSSQRPDVASVDARGQVTAVGFGAATVTATSERISDTATIHVWMVYPCRATPDGSIAC